MTPADERIVQLLAKWQKSLELHLRYTKLPDEQYWQVRAWPKHERPNRWIVDIAMQRLMALQRIVQTRLSAGDPSLSEALELMSFLSNLVGSENLERRIPQAEKTAASDIARAAPSNGAEARRTTASLRQGEPEPRSKVPTDEEVVADAVRLMAWGKAWHELPDAIARMAGRPNAAAVRKILKSRRQTIERQVEDELARK